MRRGLCRAARLESGTALIHDLTHPLATAMPGFPGDPEVRIDRDGGPGPWRVSALHLASHSGTHVDAPRHLLPDGAGIGAYSPERFLLPGLVVDAAGRAEDEALGAEVLAPHLGAIRPGSAVVLRTGWDRFWGDPHYHRHPYLGDELAAALVSSGAGLVAVDALNVDSTPAGGSSAHARLLGADVLIVENLRGLDAMQAGRPYVFAFLPLSLGDLDGGPVRALAWDPDHRFGANPAACV